MNPAGVGKTKQVVLIVGLRIAAGASYANGDQAPCTGCDVSQGRAVQTELEHVGACPSPGHAGLAVRGSRPQVLENGLASGIARVMAGNERTHGRADVIEFDVDRADLPVSL